MSPGVALVDLENRRAPTPAPNSGAARVETDQRLVFVSTAPAARREWRLAAAVVVVSLLAFAAAAPFAKTPLAPLPAFIPIYESALVLGDFATAVLLFGQFSILRSRALLVLASAYLFTSLVTVAHALTFPGVFSATGWLGAGPQSTAWLFQFWHGGFPPPVIGYPLLKRRADAARPLPAPPR